MLSNVASSTTCRGAVTPSNLCPDVAPFRRRQPNTAALTRAASRGNKHVLLLSSWLPQHDQCVRAPQSRHPGPHAPAPTQSETPAKFPPHPAHDPTWAKSSSEGLATTVAAVAALAALGEPDATGGPAEGEMGGPLKETKTKNPQT